MSTEKFNLIIPDYERYVKLSEKRRAKYYHPGDKLPKYLQKRLDAGELYWKDHKLSSGTEQRLYDIVTLSYVVKNTRVAGTPNRKIINGQGIWNGTIAQHTRNRTAEFLHDYFTPFIMRQLPPKIFTPGKDTFIQLEYIFYEDLTKVFPDYFNHALIYMKTFEDTLVDLKVIDGDSPSILRGGYPRYIHIDDPTERRLEIKFHFCKNHERIH